MKNHKIIPPKIQIETVAGLCNLRCIMCPIEHSKRKEIMNNERFTKILTKFLPYLPYQEKLSFCGLGEPLLDKDVHKKIKVAKKLGFKGIGIYTNGTLLDEKMSQRLLDAGLDALIISIDGFTNKTQSAIRVGSNLNEIVSNLEQFIALRERSKAKTKIIIRFNRQELNKHEEENFCNFWRERIKPAYNDMILVYDIHNCGGYLPGFNKKLAPALLEKIKKLKCPEIYERIMINSDGSISFCCGDQFGHYQIGNVFGDDPIKLYNSKYYIHYRRLMEKGKILELELCKNCSIPYSIATKRSTTKNKEESR